MSTGPQPFEMTLEARFVLLLLLQQPDREMPDSRVAQQLQMAPDTAHAVLYRLHAAGWLTDRLEPASTGPVRRHLYRLTAPGAALARRELAARLTEAFTILAGKLGLSVDVLRGPGR
jgi:DNA-binding MarR family transcriptional regulator